ncbi:hypothetical protein SCUCBS95973_002377 [Sporothrix curviconia]|uniref:EGF domain-specific O-linked N-acetylglucosamine transferase n=1 Tax=Sporothrix curviconia TaxID=1260050 RepID=A0ABP0B6E3_9PEZI
MRFRLDCPVRRPPDANETARGIVPFDAIQPYWFDTGPQWVFEQFVAFKQKDEDGTETKDDVQQLVARAEARSSPDGAPSFVLLVKREGAGNLRHCLMEIWSMTMTLDVLRLAQRQNGEPFYNSPADMDNTYVVVLDNHGAGPTQDLWRVFSRNPVVTLDDMVRHTERVPAPLRVSDAAVTQTNIVVPLPGGSNPLWHNDWIVRDCGPRDAPLLRLFVQRVFDHFDVALLLGPKVPVGNGNIVVTFIDRRGTRQLLDNEHLLDALRQRYPDITVQSFDFATLSLPDQLRLVQDTDVLVGVHGAGLTHAMFMRAGAGAVVEIQPEGLGYKGFRNLAAMTGQKYFGAQAAMVTAKELETAKTQSKEPDSPGENQRHRLRRGEPAKPWQLAHVRIEEDRFLALMDVAIRSVYNEGLRDEFVV